MSAAFAPRRRSNTWARQHGERNGDHGRIRSCALCSDALATPGVYGTLAPLVPRRGSIGATVTGCALFLALLAIYNANGREIGGSDSQPTKLAARSLALRGNLRLDEDVRRIPQLADRVSFAKDLQGHYRSAYSPVGSLFGAVTATGMRLLGADLDAPRGPNLIAKLTASTLTALAVVPGVPHAEAIRLHGRRPGGKHRARHRHEFLGAAQPDDGAA